MAAVLARAGKEVVIVGPVPEVGLRCHGVGAGGLARTKPRHQAGA